MYRFEDISRQISFGGEFLKLRKVLPELMNLAAAFRDQIGQSLQQEIPFGSEPLHLPFTRYPLVAEDLKPCRIS